MSTATSRLMSSRRVAALVVALAAFSAAPAFAAEASPWEGDAFSLAPAAAVSAAASLGGKDGDDAVFAFESDRYRLEADGSSTYTYRAVYKILLKKGVDRWNSASCSYQPWREDRPSIEARVIGPDGSVSMLDQSTLADQAQSEDDDVYTDSRTLTAPLPGLEPGALVEYRITLKERLPFLAAGSLYRTWFGKDVPVLHRTLAVDYPSSMSLRYLVRKPVAPGSSDVAVSSSSSQGRSSLLFRSDGLAAIDDVEDYIPDEAVGRTCVDFSTGSSWKDIARAYDAIAELVIAKAKVTDYAAAALKDGRGESRAGKIADVLARIRKDIRYTGINFGENAIVPHAIADTIERGYGDCKDQAALLVACLRAVGVDAKLALLDSGFGSDTAPELPGFGRFDHAIVYLPEDGEWVDPTAAYFRPGELPAMDRARMALVISPDTAGLVRTPEARTRDNSYRELRVFSLAESGAASVVETTSLTGILEANYRYHYATSDPKTQRERLEKYAKDAYLTDKLDDFSFSDTQDMGSAFTLKLSVEKAKRGFTDDDSAVVVLQSGNLLDFLPSFLRRKDEAGKEFKRWSEVKLDQPYVAELEFRIAPPPGFKAAALPENAERAFGPATLASSYSLEADGSVVARFRFDCIKSRYSAEEAKALHAAAVDFADEDAPTVTFEQTGRALLAAGKYREAMDEFRSLAALHPAEALHHIQLSGALEAAGFGEDARTEARKAVELEPGSALAHAQLAWTLLLGPYARTFEKGCDLPASSAEYAEAARLDPSASLYTVNRAIMDEYGDGLRRYGSGARLEDAIALYAKVAKDLKGGSWENNAPYDLLRLGRFKELKEATKDSSSNRQRKALFITAVAALDGSAAALKEAGRIAAVGDERRDVLASAGQMLITARRYPEAADIIAAGARGSQSQTQTLAIAAQLRKTHAVEAASLSRTESPSFITAFLAAAMEGKVESIAPFFAASIRGTLAEPGSERGLAEEFSRIAASVGGEDQSAAVVLDLVLGFGKFESIENGGAMATLYSVPITPSRASVAFYLKREGGSLALVDSSGSFTGIAREALSLLDAGKVDDARAWFVLLATQHERNSLFPSLETSPALKLLGDSATASAESMRLAASLILASSADKADETLGLPAVLSGIGGAKDKDVLYNLRKKAVYALIKLGRKTEALPLADQLADSAKDDAYASDLRILCLDLTGASARADRIIADALAAAPTSAGWMRTAAEHAARSGRFEEAVRYSAAVLDGGSATDGDYNQLAWYELFLDKSDYASLDKRQIVQRLMAGPSGAVQTIACVLADSGRFLEAQEAFRKYLAAETDPESASALVVQGIYAERFGLADTAAAAFRRVAKDESFSEGISCWDLAQLHLRRMGR